MTKSKDAKYERLGMRIGLLRCLTVAACLACPIWTDHAIAQDVESGRRIAQMWCEGCHQIQNAPTGPIRDDIPSFVAIARSSSTTSTSLNAFLSTPHPSMPNYSLTRQEIRDVAAYILSLRQGEQVK